jgi:hypothetical protein
LKKDIEGLIKEKANNIYEKYYSCNPCFALNEITDKENLINKIYIILKKTLITPRRKRYLNETYDLAANDTFGADSNIFFSPNLEESLKYLSPLSALGLFEEKYLSDVNRFYADEHLIYQQDSGIIPYFTIKELSCLYKNYALYIEENSKSLIERGWPEYTFTNSAWLSYKLSPNYPIEIPIYVKNFNKLKNPGSDPYFFLKRYFLYKTNQFKKYKCKTVSLSEILSYKELGFIEDMRYKFLCLKKTILNEINQYLFLKTTDKDVWFKNCVRILFGSFSQKDLQIIASIDKKYNEIKLFNITLNGGLNGLLENIIFLYEECKFEKMTLEKNTINSILKGSKFNYQGKFSSYYQLAQFAEDDYENKRSNKMKKKLNNELDKIEKEIIKNKQFMSDTLDFFKKECLNVDYLLKQKYYPFVDNLIQSFEKGESFEICIPFLNKLPTPSQKRITPLKLPSDTKWEHVTIQFLDYDKVKIQAPNKFSKVVNFRKMGFENQKNGKPNKQWELFYDLARYRGDLSWTITTYRKKVDSHPLSTPKIRKQIQRLSNTLKEYFNINDAPFYDYVKIGAYKTKFSLLPDPLNTKILL